MYEKIFSGGLRSSEFTNEFCRFLFKHFQPNEKIEFIKTYGIYWIPDDLAIDILKDEYLRMHLLLINEIPYFEESELKAITDPATSLESALKLLNSGVSLGLKLMGRRQELKPVSKIEWSAIIRTGYFFGHVEEILFPMENDKIEFMSTTCGLTEGDVVLLLEEFIAYWFVPQKSGLPSCLEFNESDIENIWKMILRSIRLGKIKIEKHDIGGELEENLLAYVLKYGPISHYKLRQIIGEFKSNNDSSNLIRAALKSINHPILNSKEDYYESKIFAAVWKPRIGDFDFKREKRIL